MRPLVAATKSSVVVYTKWLVAASDFYSFCCCCCCVFISFGHSGYSHEQYTRGDQLLQPFDLPLVWLILLFGRSDKLHEQYSRGDYHDQSLQFTPVQISATTRQDYLLVAETRLFCRKLVVHTMATCHPVSADLTKYMTTFRVINLRTGVHCMFRNNLICDQTFFFN